MCVAYVLLVIFLFKQKTAYEMRISDWSSDVCSSDLWGTTSNVDQADINVSFRMGSVPAKAGCTLYRTSGTTTSAIGGYTSPSNYSPNSLNRITKIGRASCRERVCQYV